MEDSNSKKALSDIGKAFSNLFSAVKKDISDNLDEIKPKDIVVAPPKTVDEREVYIDKVDAALDKLLKLNEQNLKKIDGYVSSSSEWSNKSFKTQDYSIFAGKDPENNPNFSKHDKTIMGKDGTVILSRSEIYDTHVHDEEIDFKTSPDWKAKTEVLLSKIEKDIDSAMKLNAVSNIASMRENFLNKSNTNQATPKPGKN